MLKRITTAVARSLRYKLLLLVLFPLLVVMPTILGLTIYWSLAFTYDQLYAKVRTDLHVANDVFARLQRDYLTQLEYLAKSYTFRTALETQDLGRLGEQIKIMLNTTNLDFLRIVDLNMHAVKLSKTSPADAAQTSIRAVTPSPLLDNAIRTGKPGVGVQIFHYQDLTSASPELAGKIKLPLIDTPGTEYTSRTAENRAMMIRAVYPIIGDDGKVVALLDGGVLLNNDFTFVDDIRDLVYGPGSVPADGVGTVTVFLGDVRISTNVPLERGKRAVGTRVADDVRKRVLARGAEWVDRTFVISDWYVGAYSPLADVYGDRIGMLNTALLEAPYTAAYTRAVAILVFAILLTAGIAGWLVIRGARSVFKPIESMTRVVRATREGEEQRIGAVASRDEIGELARQFDAMLDQLQERNREVQAAADLLEHKVTERTRELSMKNVRLQKTINMLREARQQLALAGKLSALGELTAGVAHEINNPTAVILGNMEILVRELGSDSSKVETEIDLVVEQVDRIRTIVDKLLRYARPSEYAGYIEELDINDVVDDTIALVRHELQHKSALVQTALEATNTVRINRQELQQVLVNLLINAVHAIPQGGRIEVQTRNRTDESVIISVHDFGIGIPLEELGRVFDPFFTRKEHGTGLGLSVSYGLVRRYGGTITVDSQYGKWTKFTVTLLCNPVFEESEEALMERYTARAS